MMARLALGLLLLLTAGCASYPYCDRTHCAWVWIPSAPPPAAPPASAKPAEPCPPAEPLTPGWWSDAPKPAEPVKPKPVKPVKPAVAPGPGPNDQNDHAKKIASARSDLKVGMTALELRAVTACTEPGEACVDNQGLIDRARVLDQQLAAAQLDPQLAVNWAEVTTVLRAVVDSAMRGAPK